MQLTHTPSRRVRRVWHLQYSGWQDHGCPEDVSQYLAFCEEMGALRRHTVSEITAGVNSNTPVLVHCSAGVGRTGTFIAAHKLNRDLEREVDSLEVARTVVEMRKCRMKMVQTADQYVHIYQCLQELYNQREDDEEYGDEDYGDYYSYNNSFYENDTIV